MAVKTWNGTSGTWATAGSWSPTGIPAAADTVVINGGTVTVAAQTCAGITIGGSCTLNGTSITINGPFTINGGTFTHSNTAATNITGNITNNGTWNQGSGTGAITLNGTGNVTCSWGTNRVNNVTIAKTAGTDSVTFINGGTLLVTGSSSINSIFTYSSGSLNQGTTIISCGRFIMGSGTAKTYTMSAAVNCGVSVSAAGAFLDLTGTGTTWAQKNIFTINSNVAGTYTISPGANIPNVTLVGAVTWSAAGNYNNLVLAGTGTAVTIGIYGTLTGSGTWTATTFQILTTATGETRNIGTSLTATLGTLQMNGTQASHITTYNLTNNLTIATLTGGSTNGQGSTYNINGVTVTTTLTLGNGAGSGATTFNLSNITFTGTTFTIGGGTSSTGPTYVTYGSGITCSGTWVPLSVGNGGAPFGAGTNGYHKFNADMSVGAVNISYNNGCRVFDFTAGYYVKLTGSIANTLTMDSRDKFIWTCTTATQAGMGGFQFAGNTGTISQSAWTTANAPTGGLYPNWKLATPYTGASVTFYGGNIIIDSGFTSTNAITAYPYTGVSGTVGAGSGLPLVLNFSNVPNNTTVTVNLGRSSGTNNTIQQVNCVTTTPTNVTFNIQQISVSSTINMGGASCTWNLGVLNSTDVTAYNVCTMNCNGTGTSTYNFNNVNGYTLNLSSTGATYNCYYYAITSGTPTAGTVTHSVGTLVLKTNNSNWSMSTWAFSSTSGTRGITFEDNSYVVTLNTGALNVDYISLTSVCPDTLTAGFYHASSGFWNIGLNAPSSGSAAFNLFWSTRCLINNTSYVKNLCNWYPRGDGYRIGGGLLANTAGVIVNVSGNILFSGNAFAPGQVQADSKWAFLNLTYWSTTTSTYSTGTSEFGEGGVWRAFGVLTFPTTFTGTLRLNQTLAVASVVHQGGTLDVNGLQLLVTTSYSSTDGTVNKYITNTAATATSPDIYIAATSGTPWSFAYSSLLTCTINVWVYIRGGTVSHGATARQTTFQPSFDLTERVSAYTLAPTTAFQVGGLRINNYTVPTNSVWSIGGPEFTFYTGNLLAPAAFTVNIVPSGRTGVTCQMYVDHNEFAWPQVNISTNATITCDNFKFVNLNIEGGTTTSSGRFVELTGVLGASGWNSPGTLNISNSTWVFRGSGTVINYGFLGVSFTLTSDSTGIARFEGLTGTGAGDQTAGFASGFGGQIVNAIGYNTTTGVGILTLIAGYYVDPTIPLASQIDFTYNTAYTNFLLDKPNQSAYGFPIKGSTFNIGTSSAGYRYLRGISGNWSNWGIYNTESATVVSGNYLNIASCAAKGGGGWYAGNNSVNGGGTTGWVFTAPPTYQLSSSTASVNEGATLTITLATTNLSNGATVAYTITGATSADLNGASLTGNFTISSGSASLVLSIANDYLTEGNETLTLALNNGAASISVTIIDTSLTRTYSLSRSAASVTEGSTFTITLTTTNVTNSTLVPYTISGTGLTTNDFAALLSGYTSRGTWSASTAYVTNDVVIYLGNMYNALASSTNQIPSATLGTYWNQLVGSFTGNFTITNNTNAITFLTNWDYNPESTETLTLALDNGLSTVSVDIANLLNPTYALTTNAVSLNEGGNFIITLNTTDVANNTLVPYTITGVASADINGASLTGNFTVSSNTASQTFTVTADYVTEGNETFVLTLNTIGTNVSVLLIDYTKTRTYSLSTDATTTVTEGGSFIITLTTTNVFDGTLVPYTITGVTSADINNASLTGNFTITSGVGTQNFTTTIDGIVEGTETFVLTLGSPASGSISVAIVDPSAPSAGGGNGLLLFD